LRQPRQKEFAQNAKNQFMQLSRVLGQEWLIRQNTSVVSGAKKYSYAITAFKKEKFKGSSKNMRVNKILLNYSPNFGKHPTRFSV
jgi:hypothetical protein